MIRHDFDMTKLKTRRKEYFETDAEFGRAIGLDKAAVCRNFKSGRWCQSSIVDICKVLHIDNAEIADYFLKVKE